jgi:hypothetical protein
MLKKYSILETIVMMVFDRMKASFEARFQQPWVEKHFEKTTYGKQLQSLKDRHKGERCFFIGNGPSLRAEDLSLLYGNHEITFGFNRIYNIFEETQWRPTYYISQDEKMLKGCVKIVDDLDLTTKFIPIQLRWHYDIIIHDALYFNMNWNQDVSPTHFHFSDDISHEIFCASTGMYTAAQIAAYMGFSEIYFIGVDHHFQISQDSKGEIVIDNTVKDYFSEKYNTDKSELYIPNTEKSTLTYIAMKKHCDKLGIKIYNATRGGKLEVFERADFDALF